MLPVIWRRSATKDLFEIIAFISNENPPASRRLKSLIESSVLPLSDHPYLYPISNRVLGLREIVVHPNYIIFYRVTSINIEIVNVVHARQKYPKHI